MLQETEPSVCYFRQLLLIFAFRCQIIHNGVDCISRRGVCDREHLLLHSYSQLIITCEKMIKKLDFWGCMKAAAQECDNEDAECNSGV